MYDNCMIMENSDHLTIIYILKKKTRTLWRLSTTTSGNARKHRLKRSLGVQLSFTKGNSFRTRAAQPSSFASHLWSATGKCSPGRPDVIRMNPMMSSLGPENPTENTHQTGKVHPAKWGLTLSTCGFCMILPWGSGMVPSDFKDVRSDCTWERNGNCTILQYWFCLLLSRTKKKTVKTSTMMKNVAQWT